MWPMICDSLDAKEVNERNLTCNWLFVALTITQNAFHLPSDLIYQLHLLVSNAVFLIDFILALLNSADYLIRYTVLSVVKCPVAKSIPPSG